MNNNYWGSSNRGMNPDDLNNSGREDRNLPPTGLSIGMNYLLSQGNGRNDNSFPSSNSEFFPQTSNLQQQQNSGGYSFSPQLQDNSYGIGSSNSPGFQQQSNIVGMTSNYTSGRPSSAMSSQSQAKSTMSQEAGKKDQFSRHVASVISHFTSPKDGYSRLLNEIDDFVHVVTPKGLIHFSTPSVAKFLDYSQEEILGKKDYIHFRIGKSLVDLIHMNDSEIALKYLEQSIASMSEFLMYIRYITKNGAPKLFEVRGNPYISTVNGKDKQYFVILSGREYVSKASQAFDSIVELQIETLQLKARLEALLKATGQDPSKHPLLSDEFLESTNDGQGDDYTESFLFTINDKTTNPMGMMNSFLDPFDISPSISMIPPSMSPSVGIPPQSVTSASPALSTPMATSSPMVPIPQPGSSGTSSVPDKETKKVSKKRRVVPPTDLFCLQCGTTKSPEWRAGPEGPKT
jgi:hypothetical protein